MRLFYAVTVPTEISEVLAESQRELRGNWRAVRPDQLHVTLAYLPNVLEKDLPHLRDVGRVLARDFSPFTVRLRGTGYFPNEGSPRVWFVKTDAPELDDLAARLREHLTVPYDDKPFKAHVTLARKKGPAPRLSPKVFDLSWTARRLVLFQSVLHKSGPQYDVVSHFNFSRTLSSAQSAATPQEAPHG